VPHTYTHVCILCWRRIKLGWDKNIEGWVTTEGQTHVNEYHKSEKQKEKLKKEKLEKHEKKQSFLMVGMAAAGDARSGASSAFGLSPGQYAKTKAVRYYIYGQARVSKMAFDDGEFRELLRWYYVADGGNLSSGGASSAQGETDVTPISTVAPCVSRVFLPFSAARGARYAEAPCSRACLSFPPTGSLFLWIFFFPTSRGGVL